MFHHSAVVFALLFFFFSSIPLDFFYNMLDSIQSDNVSFKGQREGRNADNDINTLHTMFLKPYLFCGSYFWFDALIFLLVCGLYCVCVRKSGLYACSLMIGELIAEAWLVDESWCWCDLLLNPQPVPVTPPGQAVGDLHSLYSITRSQQLLKGEQISFCFKGLFNTELCSLFIFDGVPATGRRLGVTSSPVFLSLQSEPVDWRILHRSHQQKSALSAPFLLFNVHNVTFWITTHREKSGCDKSL